MDKPRDGIDTVVIGFVISSLIRSRGEVVQEGQE